MSEAEPRADFEAFVLQTRTRFSYIARLEAGDLHSAEDAVQVVYLRMFQSWEKLSARQGSLEAYGKTAVKNAVTDQFRQNKRLVTVPPEEFPDRESEIGIPDAAYKMVKEGIDELIDELSDRQREVITLCVLEELSPHDVGKRLNLNEATVKHYINAALKRLQKSVKKLSEEVTV